MTLNLGRRDNPATGLHEFYLEENGEVYPFFAVKPGRVEKQRRLAQERAAKQASQQAEQPPPQA